MTQAAVHIAMPEAQRAASPRCERLYPRWWRPRAYVLSQLRREVERFIDRHLRESPRDLLIDLGCGDMPYRPLLAPHVIRYVGADLAGHQRADVLIGGDGRVELADGCADIILSSQVLEHVSDPAGYLKEARRLLALDGLLVLSTHGVWKHHPHPIDLWRWTCDGLRQVIASSGFEVIEMRGVMGLGPTGLLLLQDALLPRLPRWCRWALSGPMQLLMRAADRLHTQPQRDRDAAVFFIVARRIN